MTDKSPYVALRAFRFGAEELQPGDPVPVEAGRDYQQMLRVGQIGPAGVTAPAGQQEPGEPPPLTPYAGGDTVVFVADDGAYTVVTFVEAMEAPEEAREGLGLEEGDLVAAVTFPEDPDTAVLVPLDSLLPEQPTRRLIKQQGAANEQAQARLRELGIQLTTAEQQRDEAQRQVKGGLENAAGLTSKLADALAEVETLRSAPLLPPDALKRIEGVKGVGEKLAPVILDALKAPAAPEG